jgi:hypothetical protein
MVKTENVRDLLTRKHSEVKNPDRKTLLKDPLIRE